MKYCRTAILSCTETAKPPMWEEVHPEKCYSTCCIVYTSPTPCIITPMTKIRYIEKCTYIETQLTTNIKIDEICAEKQKTYVYPKKPYNTIKKYYIEPLKKGEPPINKGIILSGPPGTGKTAMAKIISRIIGIEPITIAPDSILSKWVGESEQRIRNIFREARDRQPSVLIIDDADWILKPRTLASEGHGGDATSAIRNIQTIMFEELQQIFDEDLEILVVATTNIKSSEIDQAFLRYGRFGDPIFIPLPDEEAVKTVIEKIVGKERAGEIARKLVNMGASMADAIVAAIKISKGEEKIELKRSGRGYTRVVVQPVKGIEAFVNECDERNIIKKDFLRKPARIWMKMETSVGVAIAAQLAYAASKPAILITDEKYIDEAVHMANSIEAVIITPTLLTPHAQTYIHTNAETPVIFTGDKPPEHGIPSYMVSIDHLYNVTNAKQILVQAVAEYKSVEYNKRLLEKVQSAITDHKKLETLLTYISVTGSFDEQALSKISQLEYFIKK